MWILSSSQPAKVSVGGGDMSVLTMPNLTHHQHHQQQQQQQQQQPLPPDLYGYSTAQPWPPIPQVRLVTVYRSIDQYSSLAVYVPISSSHAVCRCACGRCRHVTTPPAAAAAAAADSSYRSVWLLHSSAIATTTCTSGKLFLCLYVR